MHTVQRRILIVRLSHLGDVVHALPVLSALRRTNPRARIAWAVQPEFAGILEGVPGLDEIILFERRAGLAGWVRLEQELRRFAADWTIDAQGNTKSALVALAARAARRSGMARKDWTEPFAATSLTDSAPPVEPSADGGIHALDRMLALARHVAPSAAAEVAHEIEARHPLAPGLRADEHRTPAEHRMAVLHLASAGDVRSWPTERFGRLARELARDHRVLLISGPAEAAEGRALAAELATEPRIEHLTGQSGLTALRRELTSAALRGAVFIGCDSGPMHVAWAVGMRVVLLAGPQDARRTGPWPPPSRETERPRHRVVRTRAVLACAPCLSRRCSHAEGNVCMTGIDAADVARSVRELTASPKTTPATSVR